MITTATIKKGFNRGLSTTWTLTKVIVPVYLAVTFLKYTPLMGWIADLCTPLMRLFGLSGESSLVLVLGILVNLYAALGAISSLDLTSREITIIATMLLLAHNLPVESAVSGRTGVSATLMTVFRLILAMIAGILLNFLL